jgi:CheY-like chemotaxis protein
MCGCAASSTQQEDGCFLCARDARQPTSQNNSSREPGRVSGYGIRDLPFTIMSALLSPEPSASSTTGVILLVEDDHDDAVISQRALTMAGIRNRVIHLRDGEEAIKYLSREFPYDDPRENPLPALVLLDLKMPKLGGFDVLNWLKERRELSATPVVVLTGSIQQRDRIEAGGLGASAFQVKPVDFTDLITIIQDIGSQWLDRPPIN